MINRIAIAAIMIFTVATGCVNPTRTPVETKRIVAVPTATVTAPQNKAKDRVVFVNKDNEVITNPRVEDRPVQLPDQYRDTAWGRRSIQDLARYFADLTFDGVSDIAIRYYPPVTNPNDRNDAIFEIVDGASGHTIVSVIDWPSQYFISGGRLNSLVYGPSDLDGCGVARVTYQFSEGLFVPTEQECTVSRQNTNRFPERKEGDVYRETIQGSVPISDILYLNMDVTKDNVLDIGLMYWHLGDQLSVPVFEILDGATMETIFLNDGRLDRIFQAFLDEDGHLHTQANKSSREDGCVQIETTYDFNPVPFVETPRGIFEEIKEECLR